MSSVIAIQQTDAIHLITDGASYDHDGVIMGFGSKVVHLEPSNSAFAVRGAGWASPLMEPALLLFDSFDAVAEGLPMIIRLAVTGYDEAMADAGREVHPFDRHFEVTLAGWSDRMGQMVALVASTWAVRDPLDPCGQSHVHGYVPYTPWLPPQGYSQPPLDWSGVLGRTFALQEDIDALDPVLDGLTLHEAQRNAGGDYLGRAAYLVGGFAELTTVRRDSVERLVLREYPDVVGEKLVPEGGAPIELLQAVMDAGQAFADANEALENARIEARERASRSGAVSIAA